MASFSPTLEPVVIVVVNHNAGPLLLECVVSGLKCAQKVLVIDNASSDDSIDALEKVFPSEPRLEIISSDNNVGFASACNVGIELSNEPSILFLNPDCSIDLDVLRRLLGVLNEDPGVGMVGGLLLNPDGSEQGGGRRSIPTPWRSFVRAFGLNRFAARWPRLFFDFHLHKQPLPHTPITVEAISGAYMLVKRPAMEDVGPWDEGYFLHCEDLDLCMRFRQKGWDIKFVPDAPAIHHLGACSRARPIFVEWHKHKGMVRFYRKFFRHQYPGALMWLVGLGVWFRFGAAVMYRYVRHIVKWLNFSLKKIGLK